MLYSIKNIEDLKDLNELVTLQDQVKAEKLQDKLGEQNYHQKSEKLFEPITKSLENTSQDITKAITETSIKNNQAIENLDNKLLEMMNERVIIASYLISPLAKIFNPENSTQFKLINVSTSDRVNDLKINNSIPITLYNNILTFRVTGRDFELKGNLLKMITNKNYNVDLASLQDKKLVYDFAKEMHFDTKALGNKSTRDRTLIILLKSPAIMASGVSKKKILSSDPNELCDRLKLLLQEKHAGSNSDIINDEIVTLIDKLLEYKCISKKQHKQILLKCNPLLLILYKYFVLLYLKCLN